MSGFVLPKFPVPSASFFLGGLVGQPGEFRRKEGFVALDILRYPDAQLRFGKWKNFHDFLRQWGSGSRTTE